MIQGMEKSHEIKGTGIGGGVCGRFHQDGREAGHKWPLRRNTAWERKAVESPGTVTACYGYYERRYSAAGWKLSSSYSEPPFPLGHLTVAVNLKNLNSSSF